jgi:hypothetical protein
MTRYSFARDEMVLARKLLEQACWPDKINCQNINRITGDPRRKINRLINPGVKTGGFLKRRARLD